MLDMTDWLAAGLCLIATESKEEDEVEEIASLFEAVIGEMVDLPPIGAIVDIGRVLQRGQLQSSTATQVFDRDLSRALRRYEDRFLGRLFQQPELSAIIDALEQMNPKQRPFAIALTISSMLRRLRFGAGVAIDRRPVRWLRSETIKTATERGRGELRDELLACFIEGYEALADVVAEAPLLLSEADTFNVAHFDSLSRLSQRIAVTQVVEAAEWLEGKLPKTFRSMRPPEGSTPSCLEDESTYPTGGFSSLSTSGSLENLVTSELVYMDNDRSTHIDLFDVRYAENELLYYTRDESFLVRRRRVLFFVLHTDLVGCRVKHPEVPWQDIVLLLGSFMTTTRHVLKRLGEEDLELHLCFEAAVGDRGLRAEYELSNVLFQDWVESGTVKILHAPREHIAGIVQAEMSKASVQAVLVSLEDRLSSWEAIHVGKQPWTAAIKLDEPMPSFFAPLSGWELADTLEESWVFTAKRLIENLI